MGLCDSGSSRAPLALQGVYPDGGAVVGGGGQILSRVASILPRNQNSAQLTVGDDVLTSGEKAGSRARAKTGGNYTAARAAFPAGALQYLEAGMYIRVARPSLLSR